MNLKAHCHGLLMENYGAASGRTESKSDISAALSKSTWVLNLDTSSLICYTATLRADWFLWCYTMSLESTGEDRLLRAVAGDTVALSVILSGTTPTVREIIHRRLRSDLRRIIDAEDILQETDIEVFRRIGSFSGRTTESFVRWRCAIAISRLRNAIRDHRAAKRGGGAAIASPNVRRSVEDSTIALLDLLPGGGKTPSRCMAFGELVHSVQTALNELPTRNQQAIWLIHFEGETVQQVADKMGCTERAIHGLCRRGLEILGARLQVADILESKG